MQLLQKPMGKEILSISIDESVVDPEDVEMLEDLVLAAVNEALRNAEEMMAKEMEQNNGRYEYTRTVLRERLM